MFFFFKTGCTLALPSQPNSALQNRSMSGFNYYFLILIMISFPTVTWAGPISGEPGVMM